MGERVKLRRQKSNELNKTITDKADNEQLDTTDMPELEREESAAQRKKAKRTMIKNINIATNA